VCFVVDGNALSNIQNEWVDEVVIWIRTNVVKRDDKEV
jgi:hypothetical protein